MHILHKRKQCFNFNFPNAINDCFPFAEKYHIMIRHDATIDVTWYAVQMRKKRAIDEENQIAVVYRMETKKNNLKWKPTKGKIRKHTQQS